MTSRDVSDFTIEPENKPKRSRAFWRIVYRASSAVVVICIILLAAYCFSRANSSAIIPADSVDQMPPSSIRILDDIVPYVDLVGEYVEEAPKTGAAIWQGSDDVTDGEFGYFIGHAPGDFASVLELETESIVTVNDSAGRKRDYQVIDMFSVPAGTNLGEIEDRITNHGESIVLQTCEPGGLSYRITICEVIDEQPKKQRHNQQESK